MATEYGIAAADGYVQSGNSAWATVRDATAGTATNNYSANAKAVGIDVTTGRTPTYIIYRSFFAFDTSGISSTVRDLVHFNSKASKLAYVQPPLVPLAWYNAAPFTVVKLVR